MNVSSLPRLITLLFVVTASLPAYGSSRELTNAVRQGDTERALQLIRAYPVEQINMPTDKRGYSLLHQLVTHAHPRTYATLKRVVDSLLQRGGNIDIRDNQGLTPAALFVQRSALLDSEKRIEFLRYLKRSGADLTAASHDGATLLHLAARSNAPPMIQYLVEQKIKVDTPTAGGETPLMWTIGYSEENRKALMELGAEVNARDRKGDTTLHLAVAAGDAEATAALIQAGADLDAANKRGATPLSVAADRRQWALTRQLIIMGASVNVPMKSGAKVGKYLALHPELGMSELVAEKGVTPSIESESDLVLVREAIRRNDVELLRSLIEAQVRVDEQLELEEPLLQTWVMAGRRFSHEEQRVLATLLLRLGARIDAREQKTGRTPLLHALMFRLSDAARLLIEAGADINAGGHGRGDMDKTPIISALITSNAGVIDLLLDRGARLEFEDAVTWKGISILARVAEGSRNQPDMDAEQARAILERLLSDKKITIDKATNTDAPVISRYIGQITRSSSEFNRRLISGVTIIGEVPRSLSTRARIMARNQPPPPRLERKLPPVPRKEYSKEAKVHVIGVYEGFSPESNAPRRADCGHRSKGRIDRGDSGKCRRKTPGKHAEDIVTVNVGPQEEPLILVLMAYEPMLWVVNHPADVEIEGVILAGYYSQRVTGLQSDAHIEAHTANPSECENCLQDDDYFFAYSDSKDVQRYQRALAKIVRITGRSPRSFQGRYRGTTFSIVAR